MPVEGRRKRSGDGASPAHAANLAPNGSASVASTVARLTLRGTRRTFLFGAGMQACYADKDYLAIGDTHSFRDVTENLSVPTVYPGAPEPTSFDDAGAGRVALVALFRRGLRPRVDAEPVAFWRWIDVRCHDMNALRSLLTTPDLDRHVVRLHLDLTVSLSEESEVERILRDLQGTDATHGRVGVLIVDRAGLCGLCGFRRCFS